jgi:PIN domain nuclease of toxin-antitoxin system
VRLLLDSPAFLWWLSDDAALPEEARRQIANPAAVVHVSAATIWEIEIKRALGRLDVGRADLTAEIAANAFTELPITAAHAQAAARLPAHHADPFDRMLVAQALATGLTCVTRDPAFPRYGVSTCWA